MAEDTKLVTEIETRTTGQAQVVALGDAVGGLADTFRGAAVEMAAAARTADTISKNFALATTTGKTAATSVQGLAKAYVDLAAAQTKANFTAAQAAASNISSDAATRAARTTAFNIGTTPGDPALNNNVNSAEEIKQARIEQYYAEQKITDAQAVQVGELKQQLALQTSIQTSLANQALQSKRNAVPSLASGNQMTFADAAAAQEASRLSALEVSGFSKASQELNDLKANFGKFNDVFANTRYALYGFSQGLGIAGLGLAALNIGIIVTAAKFEAMYAAIQRTTGLVDTQGNPALTKFKEGFVALGESIPTSFKELGQIAVAAGQLNIPNKDLLEFTKTVAEFSATTNVSVDASATAFGRLDALLPDVRGQYVKLASAILDVGVNSVATETQIITTAAQIAATAAQVGFTAAQTIGLSAAFASLGIAAEASRGTTVRVFSQISKAVSNGGDSLVTLARLSGETATQFATDWRADAAGTFVKVLTGLKTEGSSAETVIRSLGLTATRDVSSLLKLSQNVNEVSKDINTSTSAFQSGTKLAQSYGLIIETLQGQFKILVNDAEAAFAALGNTSAFGVSGVTVFTGLIEAVQGLLKVFAAIASTPIGAVFVALIGTVTSLSAIMLLAGSAFGKMFASMLAGRPVIDLVTEGMAILNKQVEVNIAANTAATYAQTGLTKAELLGAEAAASAGVATTRFGVAAELLGPKLKSIGTSLGAFAIIGVGIAAISEAITLLNGLQDQANHNNESAAKAANNHFTSLTGLTKAMAEDAVAVRNAADANANLKGKTDGATGSTDKQTDSLGKNTAAWYANAVANDKSVQDIVKNRSKYTAEGLNVDGLITALAKNDTKAADKIYADFTAKQNNRYAATGKANNIPNASSFGLGATGDLQKIADLIKAYKGLNDVQNATGAKQAIITQINAITGASFTNVTNKVGLLGVALANSNIDFKNLASDLAKDFGSDNLIAKMAGDFRTLSDSVTAGGSSFNALSAAGSTNLANLQTSIQSTVASATAMGVSATDAVGALFLNLQKRGVDTATLLAKLKSSGLDSLQIGDVGNLLTGTTQLTGAAAGYAAVLAETTKNSEGQAAANNKVATSASAAAKSVVTLATYASNLNGVFSRSYELKFNGDKTFDAITTGWNAIATATAAANVQLATANTTLLKLSGDKAVQQYFLSVAQQYNDTLRVGTINAQLASTTDQIAAAQKDAANATSAQSKELLGNSDAAIANRATITGLVTNYQDYITSLASSGVSTATLQAKTVQLKSDFVNQATQLGFNTTQLTKYASEFDAMGTIIARLPTKVTVTANTDPATQAINEFIAGNSNGKGASAPIKVTFKPDTSALDKYNAGVAQAALINAKISSALAAQKTSPSPTANDYYNAQVAALGVQLAAVKYFSAGGYTGGAAPSAPAGIVHGQEFVIDAPNTARLGLPFLNLLNSGGAPAATSGATSGSKIQIVELTAGNLQFIANAVQVQLKIGNKTIQGAAGQANIISANTGSN